MVSNFVFENWLYPLCYLCQLLVLLSSDADIENQAHVKPHTYHRRNLSFNCSTLICIENLAISRICEIAIC